MPPNCMNTEENSRVENAGWYQAIYAGMILLLSSCQTVIEIDPPDYESELSIVSKFSPDSTWSAFITRTLPIGTLDDSRSSFFLENATVKIYEEDILIDRLLYEGDQGWYVSSRFTKPETNVPYRIEVEVPDYPLLSATSMAPSPPTISGAEISRLDAEYPEWSVEYLVKFRLEPSPSSEGIYYSFSTFFGVLEDELPGSSEYRLFTGFMYHDSPRWYCSFTDALNPFSVPVGDNYYCTIGIFSEQAVKAPTIDLAVRTGLSDLPENQDASLILITMALTPEYVEYESSIDEYYISDPFGAPPGPYTNIQGGYGIFAGYSTSYLILDLAELE